MARTRIVVVEPLDLISVLEGLDGLREQQAQLRQGIDGIRHEMKRLRGLRGKFSSRVKRKPVIRERAMAATMAIAV